MHGPPPGFPPSSYRSAVRYAEQLARYVDTFGEDRVHVILFDDLSADTEGTFRLTCEFLGVDPTFKLDFEVVNAFSAGWRSWHPNPHWIRTAWGLGAPRRYQSGGKSDAIAFDLRSM